MTAEKSFGFAIRIVRLYKILYERKEFVLSKQMLRSGTAIGALLKETDYLSEKEYGSIIEDCRELIKLTVCIVKTSKQNMNGTSK